MDVRTMKSIIIVLNFYISSAFTAAVLLLSFIAIFPLLLSLYALVRASLYLSYPLCSRKVGILSFQPAEYFTTTPIIARNEANCPAVLRTNFRRFFNFPQCNLHWINKKSIKHLIA